MARTAALSQQPIRLATEVRMATPVRVGFRDRCKRGQTDPSLVYSTHVHAAQIPIACEDMEGKLCGAAKVQGKRQCTTRLQASGHKGAFMKAGCHARDFATFLLEWPLMEDL